jgi:hypothetical protein
MNINYQGQSKNWNVDKTREEANRSAARVPADTVTAYKVDDDTRQTGTGTGRERYNVDDDDLRSTNRGRGR